MKRMMCVLLILGLLLGCAAAAAEVEPDEFIVYVRDESGNSYAYLRIALFSGEEPVRYCLTSFTNDDGYYYGSFEEQYLADQMKKDLQLKVCFGYSESEGVQACLDVMFGNVEPVEEEVATLDFKPEFGKAYYFLIGKDENGAWTLEPIEP